MQYLTTLSLYLVTRFIIKIYLRSPGCSIVDAWCFGCLRKWMMEVGYKIIVSSRNIDESASKQRQKRRIVLYLEEIIAVSRKPP